MRDLRQKAGTVTVNLAPLLIICGAAMAATDGEIEDILEMLEEGIGEDRGDEDAPAA